MPQLGLGNGLQRFNVIPSYKGALDILGNVDNCVFTFSPYKRLTGAYKDELVRVNSVIGMDTRYFGADRNGNIESTEIMNWLDGDIGVVDWVCNERKTSNPSENSNLTYCPEISDGSFHTDGLKFDGIDDFLKTDDYSEVQIIEPELSIYMTANHLYTTPSYIYSYSFSKNYDSTNVTYAILKYYDGSSQYRDLFKISTNSLTVDANANNNLIANWQTKTTNGRKTLNNTNNNADTLNATATNYQYLYIGARSLNASGDSTANFYGNIKTILMFNNNQYSNYNNFVNAGI